jgi:hypothetical protein
MAMSTGALRVEKDCAGESQQQLKLQTHPLLREGAQ